MTTAIIITLSILLASVAFGALILFLAQRYELEHLRVEVRSLRAERASVYESRNEALANLGAALKQIGYYRVRIALYEMTKSQRGGKS